MKVIKIVTIILLILGILSTPNLVLGQTLNPNLQPLHYQINNGSYSTFTGGYMSVDGTSFTITISVDLNEADTWKDYFDVSMGPWTDRFQVWVDGGLEMDSTSSLPTYYGTLTKAEYGDRVIVKVRVEGSYQDDGGHMQYIYNEVEKTFTFSQQPSSLGIVGIVLIGGIVIAIVAVIVVMKKRSNPVTDSNANHVMHP